MICAVIKGPTKQAIKNQLAQAKQEADLVELRIDAFKEIDLDFLTELRKNFSLPMIFTLRSQKSEAERQVWLEKLAALQPEYLDLDYDLPKKFIKKIALAYPKIKIILSYHNFKEVPDLEKLYQKMAQTQAHYYKIAVTPQSSIDTLKLLKWVREKEQKVIAIAMGSKGEISRILAPLFGIPITYAFLDANQQTAEGQFAVETLRERYHYNRLSRKTALYALIGDPVTLSISDVTHNQVFKYYNWDAVYVKIQISSEELGPFIQLAKALLIQGISVTMPLKEAIIPHLDLIDPMAKEIGAVNTLILNKGKYKGTNTDGAGALNAIQQVKPIAGLKIAIIGAGGAAKAIGYEAIQRGATVLFINRTRERALRLAKQWSCEALSLDEALSSDPTYDVLVNTLPVDIPQAIQLIHPKKLIMDIRTRPKETLFLQAAKRKHCPVIYGSQMFIEQALGQFHTWDKN